MRPQFAEGAFDSGRESVEKALRVAWGTDGVLASETMVELDGGASSRRFFRVEAPFGTAIAMQMPPPSAELAQAKQANQAKNFLEVQKLLKGIGVPVPDIYFEAPHPEVMLLEDLGSDTLLEFLRRSPEHQVALYREAIAILARAQIALRELPPTSSVRERSFDQALLEWEVEHFREWALVARGLSLTPEENRTFDEAKHFLAATISELPYGFTHRDYQSKNLMVRLDDKEIPHLTWIDFQDAMLGPRVYDLVALLMDSYQDFPEEFVLARLAEYHDAYPHPDGFEALLFEFSLVTVQRKLKDAGRFIFLDRRQGNPGFLPFVDGSVTRAKNALARIVGAHPSLEALSSLLARY